MTISALDVVEVMPSRPPLALRVLDPFRTAPKSLLILGVRGWGIAMLGTLPEPKSDDAFPRGKEKEAVVSEADRACFVGSLGRLGVGVCPETERRPSERL